MKISPVLTAEEHGALDEDLREAYVARDDGSFILESVQGWESAESIAGLKDALRKERSNSRESYRRLKELEAARDNAPPPDDSEVKQLRRGMKALALSLERVTKDAAIAEAVSEAGAIPLAMKSFLKDKVRFEIEGDEAKVYVAVEDKKVPVSAYVSQLREAAENKSHPLHQEGLGSLFVGRTRSGGGTPPHGSGAGASVTSHQPTPRRSSMTPKDKVAYIRQHGQDAFLSLPS